MTLLTRVEGLVSSTQLTNTLAPAVTRTRTILHQRRAIKNEQESARELRRMQDQAYSNSLAQDRARDEAERRRQEETRRRLAAEQERVHFLAQLERNREQWRLWKCADLKKRGLIGLKSEIGKTARVGLRLINGRRIVQIFPGDLALAEVYSFVECYDLLFPTNNNEGVTLRSSAGSNSSYEEPEKPEEYEHEFMFRLVVPYPRKVIGCGFTRIKDEPALWPSGSIVVEEVERDSDDEEEDDSEGDE
jgi:FAS-associated factor 2